MYGMEEFLNKEAYELSLGQKQRVTIAGVLSLKPKVIVMDEPTAMLDPEGKEDIKRIVRNLKNLGFTIVYITNVIDEVFISDRVIILENGKISGEFNIENILDNIEFLKEKGITIPKVVETMQRLNQKGIEINLDELI